MDKLKDDEWVSKIIKGLELAYAKMLEFKKQNKSDLPAGVIFCRDS